MGEDLNLGRTIASVMSVIAMSHTVRAFSVKWQLIRKRLEELNSGLIALENALASSHDRRVVELLALVQRTVHECHGLGSLCINVSYTGKLLMQSDLDKVIFKLDLAVSKLTAIYHTDGILSGGLALVVSRPPAGAARDEMKFYVKDLLNRLKIGDCRMKKQALVSLNELITQNEKYVKIVVDLDDFLLILSSCLDSNDSSIQEEAAMVVEIISSFDSYKGSLIISGVVALLVRVLENGTYKAKEYSLRSLMRLTENGESAWALSAHGGVSVLLSLCSRDDDKEVGLIGSCCWVLRNVVIVEEIKRFVIEDGVISTFIKLIKSQDELAQIGSIEFLKSLVFDDECIRNLVIQKDGARVLVQLLDPRSSFSFKLRETAIRAIEDLCFSSADCVNLLISYGFMNHLLYFLRKGDVSTQELAFKSSVRLCGTSEEARKSMGDAGFMSEFVRFLDTKSYEIREMAAEALCSMVMVPKNRKKFANNDHNIGTVLQLLDPKDGNSSNSKLLFSILLSISNYNHARKIISHSKYIKNIEKLAETGVSDAKKITRKLSSNRFKSLLNGILHS